MGSKLESLMVISGLFFLMMVVLSTQHILPWLHWGPMIFHDFTVSELLYFLMGIGFIVLSELDWS